MRREGQGRGEEGREGDVIQRKGGWSWSNTENVPKRAHFCCLKAEGME